ncbi:DNA polymerase III subunit delta' [Fredinandcohnia quinoae]|uniref:DNA polymerase III subunit delta' n=1 Tax=Fredinandcohnia quinoae TaxID=2918902 RepID=A0AAW5E217_9BACI|nr:DNA polymerase III subunit delta' [Fredinandcohnia sp. SECRCQ15]MCH1626957.1 DNA polymerase III subunit delta' [Fredinandcohnia sp. SECRCQ15]
MEKTWEQLEEYQPMVLKMVGNSLKKERVAHAYLFEGSRGTGKKEVAFLLAKSLFCTNKQDYRPCNDCVNCRRISSGNHPDIHMIEPDGQSIKKGQIQALQEEFSKTGVESNRKIYIINHADKMTANAANSLLKFLEEPSSQTVAILVTEQIHRILNTILSRCQVLSFKPLLPKVISEQLVNEGISTTIASLIANTTNNLEEARRLSTDAWFGQCRSIVLQLYEVLNTRPADAFFVIQDKWLQHFKEKDQLSFGLDILLLVYKDLLYIQLGDEESIIFHDQVVKFKQYALQTSSRRISDQITAIFEAKRRLHTNMNPHLLMEQLVIKLQEGLKLV